MESHTAVPGGVSRHALNKVGKDPSYLLVSGQIVSRNHSCHVLSETVDSAQAARHEKSTGI